MTNCIHTYFTALSSGKYPFWDINFGHGSWYESRQAWWFDWAQAFLSFSVKVCWRGRTQGVWPASGSRGTVIYSGVASHHNSHRDGNYVLLYNHISLLNCFLFAWKFYNFWAQESGLYLYLFRRPLPSAACSFRITSPPNLRLGSISELFSTADLWADQWVKTLKTTGHMMHHQFKIE